MGPHVIVQLHVCFCQWSPACTIKETQKGQVMAIRLRVKEIAQSQGISQGKLSRLSDVSLNTIKRIWSEEGYVTKTETLEKIAKALGVKAGDLLEEVPDDAE